MKTTAHFLFFLLLFQFTVNAQVIPSEELPVSKQQLAEIEIFTKQSKLSAESNAGPYLRAMMPVRSIILADANGQHNLDPNQIEQYVTDVNAYFTNANIHFYSVGVEVYTNTTGIDMFQIHRLIGSADQINVYWSEGYGGIAQMPGEIGASTYVGMGYSAGTPVLAHELGHSLGLLHTFDTTNGIELADQSNCSTAGDLVCDTPADPEDNSQVSNCVWVGNRTDPHGTPYHPLVNNIMSYYSGCRESFTPGQEARMRMFLKHPSRVLMLTTPEAPSNLQVSKNVAAGNISLSWTDHSSLEGQFEIEKIVEGDTSFIVVDNNITTYIDTEVSSTKQYEYRVRAINYVKHSAWTERKGVLYGTGGECPGIAVWSSSAVYVGGNQVVHNGIKYQAKWWTQGENPSTHSGAFDVWTNLEPCGNLTPDPYVAFVSPRNNDKLYYLTSQPQDQVIQVLTNHEIVGIDSVLYVIVDNYANSGNVRRIKSTAYPFSVSFTPAFSLSTDITAVPFSNGVAGDIKSIRVTFHAPQLPTLSIVNPIDESNFYLIEGRDHSMTIKTDVNYEYTSIDSVYLEIVYNYANSGTVEKHALRSAPYEYTFTVIPAVRIDIRAVAFDRWGRYSELQEVSIFPVVYNPQLSIISPVHGSTIDFNPANPSPVQVNVAVNGNGTPIRMVTYFIEKYIDGVSSLIAFSNDETEPFDDGFSFIPQECDSLRINVGLMTNVGPFVTAYSDIYLNTSTACSVAPWNPSVAYVSGNKVEYQGNVYKAKWWTLNEIPALSGPYDVWANEGPCSSSNQDQAVNYTVSPNPASSEVSVSASTYTEAQVQVANAQGDILRAFPMNGYTATFNVSGLASGFYYVKIQTAESYHVMTLVVQ